MGTPDWLQLLDWEIRMLFIGIILTATITSMYLEAALKHSISTWSKLWSADLTIEEMHTHKCNELSKRQASCSSVEEHDAVFEDMRQYRNTQLIGRQGYLALLRNKQPVPEEEQGALKCQNVSPSKHT